ncbi:MAG: glutamyl-tRNA reductase [Flavobacteriales bacterium]|nr:glutamyl-tRNA reductase [Flavobacteriales bacterium]
MKNSLITVGISHWKSPVDIREKFSIDNKKNKLLIQEAKKIGIKSIFIISTCNRTQIFANNANPHTLKKLLINHSKGNEAEFQKFGFIIKNEDAINKLYEISTGIDSQILGDLQIFSQVKESIKIAKSLKSIDSYTDRLLQFVFKANKEVQNFTNISKGAASIAHAVNLFIQEIFNDYKEKRILLFGLGDIGKITTENIINQGSKNITIINRTYAKTKKIAEKLNVKFDKIENLDKIIRKSDIVIVSTDAKNYTITKKNIDNSKKLLIDLSVPRNIDPKLKKEKNIKLINIDDLNNVKDSTLKNRNKDLPKVKTIINLHKLDFKDWEKLHFLGPTIKKINSFFEFEKNNEINKYKKKYSKEEIEKLIPLIDSILKRISRKNIDYLRKRYRNNSDILEIINEMYNLDAY